MTDRYTRKPIITGGTFSVTVGTTNTVTLTVPSNAGSVVMQVDTADIRVTFDGSTPVAGVGGGILYVTGTDYKIEGWDSLTAFKAKRDGSADARITGQFFTKE